MTKLDAELSILGCILIDMEAIKIVRDNITLKYFHSFSLKPIVKAMFKLDKKGKSIDIITLSDQLKKDGKYVRKSKYDMGTEQFLVNLTSRVPTAANLEHYIKELKGGE